MASDSKAAGNAVTKEIESRIKQTPEHLFEVFLEIREPIDTETPEILLKYPSTYPDEYLRTVTNFAYPCKIPSDDQSEHFAFVILDQTGSVFRFGYCRRSNKESICLCILSFYPWFDVFYKILNDLSQVVLTKSSVQVQQFLSSLYNYKLMSLEDFYKNEGKENIELNILSKNYIYTRPDPRKLPSMLSSLNFTVMVSILGSELILNLFSHLLFERRIIFVSSKLFHLTACAYGCLHLIYPMYWQGLLLPILPSSMTWTTQCTTPYIIGVHTSLYSTLNIDELGDVVVVNIDERKIESQYNDLNLFPKYLIRSMRKGIQQSSKSVGDNLARVFLRAMAFTIGNYANGFDIKDNKLDFDRERYLESFLGSQTYSFAYAVAHTQMFEQFSRYRTYLQLQREVDIDEFDIEVKNLLKLQESKKFKANKKIYKLLERYIKDGTTLIGSRNNIQIDSALGKGRKSLIDTKDERFQAKNPLFEQVQNRAEKIQTVINRAGQRVASEASSVRNNLTSLDLNDVMKRTHHSKLHQSLKTNSIDDTKSIHQSSTPDLHNEQSIPYERMQSSNNIFCSDRTLTNQDQLLSLSLSSSSFSSSSSVTPEIEKHKINNLLINLDADDENLPLPSHINVKVINTETTSPSVQRQMPQIDPKIKQLQNELQHKVQTFESKRVDPRNEYGQEKKEIKKIAEQFDPFDDTNYFNKTTKPSNNHFSKSSVILRDDNKLLPSNTYDRHPSMYETIPTNYVSNVLQNIQTVYGTPNRANLRLAVSVQEKPKEKSFSSILPVPTNLAPMKPYSAISDDFDPLAPSASSATAASTKQCSSSATNESNLIDFN